MDFDLLFVTGLALVAFAIPSAVKAYADWRWPKTAITKVVLGGVALAYAAQENPGVYALDTVDDVIVSVVGGLLNN